MCDIIITIHNYLMTRKKVYWYTLNSILQNFRSEVKCINMKNNIAVTICKYIFIHSKDKIDNGYWCGNENLLRMVLD